MRFLLSLGVLFALLCIPSNAFATSNYGYDTGDPIAYTLDINSCVFDVLAIQDYESSFVIRDVDRTYVLTEVIHSLMAYRFKVKNWLLSNAHLYGIKDSPLLC